MKRNTTATRRQFLIGTGAATLALPLLPQVTRAAVTPGKVKNLIIFWVPDGTPRDRDQAVSKLLAKHRADVAILRNGQHTAYEREYGSEEHPNAPRTLLTGGQNAPTRKAGALTIPPGRSMDQIAGDVLGGTALFPTYELGAYGSNQKDGVRHISFDGKDKPRTPVYNPVRAFGDLLSGVSRTPGTDNAEAAAAARRKLLLRGSVLDSVVPEIKRVCADIGPTGRDSMDAYLTRGRAVEKRIQTLLNQGASTSGPVNIPGLPSVPDAYGQSAFYEDVKNFNVVGEAQLRIAAAALATGSTRVVTMSWGTTGPTTVPDWLPNRKLKGVFHHRLSHPKDDPREACDHDRQLLYNWYEEQLSFLLDRLAEIDMGGERLLDQTVVLRLSESNASGHNTSDLPISVSGGRSVFAVGKDYDMGGRPHNDVMVALLQGLGIEITAIGRDDSNKGAFAPLLR